MVLVLRRHPLLGGGVLGDRPARRPGLLALRLKLSAPGGLGLTRLDLERLLRLFDLRQALLATPELLGQLIATAVSTEALILLSIDLLSLREQRVHVRSQHGDLGFELGLLADHPLVAHRLMPRGVRAQLRAIQRKLPSPTSLACLQSLSACTNSPPSTSK